jgi:hypothetical protein
VLFSDGRFSSPDDAGPVFPVLDPMLENTTDAAITGMNISGDNVFISVTNNGPPRTLTLHGVAGPTTFPVTANETIVRPIASGTDRILAELSSGDLWPENDAMSIRRDPSPNSERWWIAGRGTAPAGWRQILPGKMPSDTAGYLAPSIVVLDNLAAGDLSFQTQQRLEQYVRDLGGSLLILGADHAFGAGGYDGTILGSMSPLESSPPGPATDWILLADSSGSMSEAEGNVTRWDLAAGAIVELLPHLPPQDLVRVGQFSDSIRWWSQGKSARQTAQLALPPPDAVTHGPTNLQAALEAIAAAPSGSATQLLLVTDADVHLNDPTALAAKLKAANIRVHLLAIGAGQGLGQLDQIISLTGGTSITEFDPRQWAASVRRLLTGALPDRLVTQTRQAKFTGPASAIGSISVSPSDRTWLAPKATLLADDEDHSPLAAQWQFGAGRVLAVGFDAITQADALANLIAQLPRDPRLNVSWDTGRELRVSVDAVDGKKYLNDLPLTLEIWDQISPASQQAIPQTGPGLYELTVPTPRQPAIATVKLDGRWIDRLALAGRYAPEFDAVGEDRAALEALAAHTGGQLIPPSQTTPIEFHFPLKAHPLDFWLAAAGAVLIGLGLIAWKRAGSSAASV